MADITKCKGTNCPLREKCYRHTAVSNEFAQSYFTIVPYDVLKKKCVFYWNNKDYIKKKDKELSTFKSLLNLLKKIKLS